MLFLPYLFFLMIISISSLHATSFEDEAKDALEEICANLQYVPARAACLECFHGDQDYASVWACTAPYLPKRLEKCLGQPIPSLCVSRNMKYNLEDFIHRNQMLHKKGGSAIDLIRNYETKQLAGAPAAILSCFVQDCIISQHGVQDFLVENAPTVFDRFEVTIPAGRSEGEMNQLNRVFKVKKNDEREDQIVQQNNEIKQRQHAIYEHGETGLTDIPFDAVGPLAHDIMEGIEFYKQCEENGKQQEFFDNIINTPFPVPAWIFKEFVKSVDDLVLPEM